LEEGLEGDTADEAQFGIPQRVDGSRPRCPVDHRQLSNERAWSKNRQDTFIAFRSAHANLEQALFDPVAAVARIPGEEHHLIGCQFEDTGLGEEVA